MQINAKAKYLKTEHPNQPLDENYIKLLTIDEY